ncbi:flagellar basal body protein FliL [Brucepastera parasyntrophica]|uniref:flagellar basal body-associated FliL family protein n=1 Tax=Brucepastera parasyntrophica TaxID=2880008 RepID=UPI00210C0204|nr:flagellar basal body-associated FliL family protein [Brucepastera parasyntrophica]ULQ59798.1 flagellar basal body protein FliL [Brucepastera parasyntrophica]
MSDQDDINLDTGDSGDGGGKKGSGLFPQLLKWVAIVLGALIFIVTVVVITVNIISGSGKNQTSIPSSEEYVGVREVLQWYQAVGTIQTRTSDPIPASVLVDIALGYTFDDKATPTELTSRLVELKDFLRSYFNRKTVNELRNEEKVKIEIRNYINDNILSKTKIKDVRFTRYEIVEQ